MQRGLAKTEALMGLHNRYQTMFFVGCMNSGVGAKHAEALAGLAPDFDGAAVLLCATKSLGSAAPCNSPSSSRAPAPNSSQQACQPSMRKPFL